MLNLNEAYFSIYNEEENEERRYALAKADKNYRGYDRGGRVRAKIRRLINSENPEDVKRGYRIHAANAQGSKKSIARSARNIQRGPGPRRAKADAERDMRASGFKEEFDMYDIVVDYLIAEGFVRSFQEAKKFIKELSEEEIEYLCEAFIPLNRKKEGLVFDRLNKLRDQSDELVARSRELRKKPFSRYRPRINKEIKDIASNVRKNLKLGKNAANALLNTNQQKMDASQQKIDAINAKKELLKAQISSLEPKNKISRFRREEFDIILDYLIVEGFAETEDAAVKIMSVMSEEWIDCIF